MRQMKRLDPRVLPSLYEHLLQECAGTGTRASEQVLEVLREYGTDSAVLVDVDEYSGDRAVEIVLFSANGTTTLSHTNPSAAPWVLRGAQRWNEQDVVSVDGETLTIDDVCVLLDVLWEDAPVLGRLIDECIIRRAVRERGVTVSVAEHDAAVERFRRMHHLTTNESLDAWLRSRGVSARDFSGSMSHYVAREKFESILVEESAQPGGPPALTSPSEFAVVLRCAPLDRDEAVDTVADCRSGRRTLLEVVSTRLARGQELLAPIARGSRSDFPDVAAGLIFRGAAGEVLPPVQTGTYWTVLQVLALGRLDDTARAELVRSSVLRAWLDGRRGSADIQWLWGHGDLPGEPARP